MINKIRCLSDITYKQPLVCFPHHATKFSKMTDSYIQEKPVILSQESMSSGIDAVRILHNKILTLSNPIIRLLQNKEVLQWLHGDYSFLPAIEKTRSATKNAEKYKVLEDEWGRRLLKTCRPDLKCDGQWTGPFGQEIAKEIYNLLGYYVSKPVNISGYEPDLVTDLAVIEVKTCTLFTTGTANEKILGVPFKYADVPELYGKPLDILCLAGAERACRQQYGTLEGDKCSDKKRGFLEFYAKQGIRYVSATELLKKLII